MKIVFFFLFFFMDSDCKNISDVVKMERCFPTGLKIQRNSETIVYSNGGSFLNLMIVDWSGFRKKYMQQGIRGSLNKFPDFFRIGTLIDSTHMKLCSPSK